MFNNLTAEQIIADILMNEMGLAEDQVWIRNQNKEVPADKRMYIVVGETDSQAMAVTNNAIDTVAGMDEIQQVQMRENIMIDLFSVTNEASQRRLEVLAALSSIYSQQAQELNIFKIFDMPTSFLNTSAAEGGSTLNRFSILIRCFVWYRKQKPISNLDTRRYNNGDYYDQYAAKGYDEQALEADKPIFEFNLTEQ